MMTAYYSFNALIGEDEQCMEYISKCSQTQDIPKESPVSKDKESALDEAIIKGIVRKRLYSNCKITGTKYRFFDNH